MNLFARHPRGSSTRSGGIRNQTRAPGIRVAWYFCVNESEELAIDA